MPGRSLADLVAGLDHALADGNSRILKVPQPRSRLNRETEQGIANRYCGPTNQRPADDDPNAENAASAAHDRSVRGPGPATRHRHHWFGRRQDVRLEHVARRPQSSRQQILRREPKDRTAL